MILLSCWMSLEPFPFYYTFLAPLGLIVGVNVVVCVLTIIGGCCSSRLSKKGGGAGVVASLLCLTALGVYFVFSVFCTFVVPMGISPIRKFRVAFP